MLLRIIKLRFMAYLKIIDGMKSRAKVVMNSGEEEQPMLVGMIFLKTKNVPTSGYLLSR
jgi:hypothetical protein